MTTLGIEELRTLFLFEGLTDVQLAQLAAAGEVRTYDVGVVVVREGDPAEHFLVLLDGRVRLSRLMSGEDVTIVETSHRGSYAGAIRAYTGNVEASGETYTATMVALDPSRFFRLPAPAFGSFVRSELPMAVHLLDGLYLGIRNTEAQVRQREHLAALGTLSANLAHELNNPAAAGVRASAQLRARVAGTRRELALLAGGDLPPEALRRLVALQERAVARSADPPASRSPMEVADAEDALAERLEELGVDDPYESAAALAAAGLDLAWLEEVMTCVDPTLHSVAVRWLAYALETEALMNELQDVATRISTLVASVKQYAHLDAAEADVDLHAGLDSTVVMLGPKLGGLRVVKEYDLTLPRVRGFAGELNQVWTNLLDNAAGALSGGGQVTLRTSRDGDDVVVEVRDDGPGIPPEVLPRVFDTFFTTKPAGLGSGLGLDNVKRIVERRHGGTVEIDSSTGPGPTGTAVRVRLPVVGRT